MENRCPFREFIEGLKQINGLGEDPDVKAVDEALAYWISEHLPRGFEFDYDRRNLIIAVVKKKAKMADLIVTSDFGLYIDALLNMVWREIWQKESTKAERLNKDIDNIDDMDDIDAHDIMMEILRAVFILGYCLRSLEKKKRPPKKKNR